MAAKKKSTKTEAQRADEIMLKVDEAVAKFDQLIRTGERLQEQLPALAQGTVEERLLAVEALASGFLTFNCMVCEMLKAQLTREAAREMAALLKTGRAKNAKARQALAALKKRDAEEDLAWRILLGGLMKDPKVGKA